MSQVGCNGILPCNVTVNTRRLPLLLPCVGALSLSPPLHLAHTLLADLQDPATASDSKLLVGHAGAIFGLSFSPDQLLLLSCSEDRTSRCGVTCLCGLLVLEVRSLWLL